MSIGVKKKFIITVVLAVALVFCLGAAFWLKPKKEEVHIDGKPIEQGNLQLVCMTDTNEEAEKIAADYGIELLSYAEKVAVFQTDKSYAEILEIGKDKGLPGLSPNNIMKAY